jgi:hypothetical protein
MKIYKSFLERDKGEVLSDRPIEVRRVGTRDIEYSNEEMNLLGLDGVFNDRMVCENEGDRVHRETGRMIIEMVRMLKQSDYFTEQMYVETSYTQRKKLIDVSVYAFEGIVERNLFALDGYQGKKGKKMDKIPGIIQFLN